MNGVFIHIPKNAGSSIEEILPEICPCFKHSPAREVQNILHDYDARFSFAFVRNPWDRTISLFEFLKKFHKDQMRRLANVTPVISSEGNEYKRILAGDKNKFIKSLFENDFHTFIEELVLQRELKHVGVHGHAQGWQQKEWITKDQKIIVDFIGKVENIKQDIEEVRKKFEIKTKLPWINSTVKAGLQQQDLRYQYYNKTTMKLIEKAYRDDIEMFNYKYKCGF